MQKKMYVRKQAMNFKPTFFVPVLHKVYCWCEISMFVLRSCHTNSYVLILCWCEKTKRVDFFHFCSLPIIKQNMLICEHLPNSKRWVGGVSQMRKGVFVADCCLFASVSAAAPIDSNANFCPAAATTNAIQDTTTKQTNVALDNHCKFHK